MDTPVQRRELLWPVTGKLWIYIRHNAAIQIEAEALILQIVKRDREQSGCRQQNKREGGLEYDQQFARQRSRAERGAAGAAKGFSSIARTSISPSWL